MDFFLARKMPDKTTYIVQKPQLNRSSSACAEHFSIYRGHSIPVVVGLRKGSSLSLRSSQNSVTEGRGGHRASKYLHYISTTTITYHPVRYV